MTIVDRWHPVAASADLPFRHVFHGQLLGRELAIWRADDGFVNVWENRCLHRGVRLSIGINDGRELKCQYHGWRYSNRTAGCTYIPAHPADSPARTITNRTYPMVERYGLIWTALSDDLEPPTIGGLNDAPGLLLRGIPVSAPSADVLGALEGYRFHPHGESDLSDVRTEVERVSEYSIAVRAKVGDADAIATFLVQPVDANRSVIRGVLSEPASADIRARVLKAHNLALSDLRDDVEASASSLPASLDPGFELLPAALAEMPERVVDTRTTLRVAVARKWDTATSVTGLELTPVTGMLPTFQPGAHIDLHLPNGLVRQYSLTNAPGETGRYVIGVKRGDDPQGGSRCVHDVLREGDVLAISAPRNNFSLRRDARKTIFIAGGIGITPLLSMAAALNNQNLPYELHYFVRHDNDVAFGDRLREWPSQTTIHVGLARDAVAEAVQGILSSYRPGTHMYVCGPGALIELTRQTAAQSGWSDSAVHFEYFQNDNVVDDSSSFEIALARSCVTLQVPAGRTILEVLRDNGIEMPSSCEQGACGTCLATVLEGEPDHQDVYLSPSERQRGEKIMTCVSRARSPRLVLDI